MDTFGPFTKRSKGNQPGVSTGTSTYDEYDSGSSGLGDMKYGSNRRLNKTANTRIVERYNAMPMGGGWHKNLFYHACWVLRLKPPTQPTDFEEGLRAEKGTSYRFLGADAISDIYGYPVLENDHPMIDAQEFLAIEHLAALNYALMYHAASYYNEGRTFLLKHAYSTFEPIGGCHISPAVQDLWDKADGAPLIKNFTIEGPIDLHNYWGRKAKQGQHVYWIYEPRVVEKSKLGSLKDIDRNVRFRLTADAYEQKLVAIPSEVKNNSDFVYWVCVPFVETPDQSLSARLEAGLKDAIIKGETVKLRAGFADFGHVMTGENAYHPSGIAGVPLYQLRDPEAINKPLTEADCRDITQINSRGTIRVYVDLLSTKHFYHYMNIEETFDPTLITVEQPEPLTAGA